MDEQPEAKSIFLAAIEKAPLADRTAFLDEACAGNAELRQRVDALLAAHDKPAIFLNHPFVAVESASADAMATSEHHTAISEKPGTVIDRYKLLEQIGEGGFGVVYMAEQTEPVQRRVALKIIKPGMDTKEVVARFEAERQALARMEHPNIARVLDAGTTASGRPYFVMELVRGIPIVDYCDKHSLSIKDRLTLFIDVCHGVQHAHQKGIIHRDIKPSNILVTLHDTMPVPKVIDFGIAKATSERLTEKTLFTSYGQLIGTPQYMSPEQSDLSGLDIDTRSDIYALGALLYELLTGSPPFEPERLRSAGFAEVLRVIREEEPPKPSQRLNTSNALPSIASSRHVEPKKLTLLIRGELDWVVMKALEKDRARRYETANGLASDIRRYLNDEPVAACPPSVKYRFEKFARRNKVAIATATVVAAALIAGLFGTAWQAYRAIKAERIAQANLQEAVSAQQRADENFRRARQAVDEYFTVVSESTLLDEEGMQPLRKQLLESALRYYEEFAQQQTDDPTVLAELAATHYRMAMTQVAMGSADWVQPYIASLEIIERLLQDNADMSSWASLTDSIFTYHRVGNIVYKNAEEALAALERGIHVFGSLLEGDPGAVGVQHDLAASHFMAGNILQDTHQWEPAIAHLQQARQIWEAFLDTGRATDEIAGRLADTYRFLETSLLEAGRREDRRRVFQEGIATLRAAYGDEQPEVANLLRLAPATNTAEREANLRESIKIYEKALSRTADSPRSMPEVRWNLGRARLFLGRLLRDTDRIDEAEREILAAKELAGVLVEQNPSNRVYRSSLADAGISLGIVYDVRGRFDEARQEYQQSLKILQVLVAQAPATPEYHRMLGVIARRTATKTDFSWQVNELRRQLSEVVDVFRDKYEEAVQP